MYLYICDSQLMTVIKAKILTTGKSLEISAIATISRGKAAKPCNGIDNYEVEKSFK